MLTPGYLAQHYRGQKGGRDPAFIDIAQDHALKILDDVGVFQLGAVFKGGTAIRKFHAGSQGRFSTDLDFSVEDPDVAKLITDSLDGATLGGFKFSIDVVRPGRTAYIRIANEALGAPPTVSAKIDLSPRPVWLSADHRTAKPLPIHRAYGFSIPTLPIMRTEEILSEKLARYRRHQLARDLYDLAWFSTARFDEPLVRRLTVLKVWHDVVRDRLGDGPFDPAVIIAERHAEDFEEDAIGVLTQPIDLMSWIAKVRTRYAFITDLGKEEIGIARCSCGDAFQVEQMVRTLH